MQSAVLICTIKNHKANLWSWILQQLIHEFCMNDLYVNCNRCINALMIWICKLNRIDTRHKICILHVWNWAFPTVTFPGKIFYKLLLFFLLLLLFIAINVIICYYFYIFDIWKHYSQKETRLLGPWSSSASR